MAILHIIIIITNIYIVLAICQVLSTFYIYINYIHIISFNPHSNLMWWAFSDPDFTDEEAEVQKSDTHPW